MTNDIRRILYAIDLSANSAYAFGYAKYLAKNYDAEITLLHVIDKIGESFQMAYAGVVNAEQLGWNLETRITHVTEEINKRLKIFIDKNAADNPGSAEKVASIEVCKGYPADEIIKKADNLQCDVIVM